MTPFQAFEKYCALKSHFTSPKYDYFRYNGKLRVSKDNFEKRNDKYMFNKLAKHDDVEGLIVSHCLINPGMWIGDIVQSDGDKIYNDWVRRKSSLAYTFKKELDGLDDDFNSNFRSIDGQHPVVLCYLLRRKISVESFIVLNEIVNFYPYFDRKIDDKVIWPREKGKCIKYRLFLEIDVEKMKKIVTERYESC